MGHCPFPIVFRFPFTPFSGRHRYSRRGPLSTFIFNSRSFIYYFVVVSFLCLALELCIRFACSELLASTSAFFGFFLSLYQGVFLFVSLVMAWLKVVQAMVRPVRGRLGLLLILLLLLQQLEVPYLFPSSCHQNLFDFSLGRSWMASVH